MRSELCYLLFPDTLAFADVCQYCQLVSSERQEKIRNLRQEKDQIRSLLAELLLRRMIIEHIPVRNDEIELGKEARGKLYLKNREDFHFSLSHSGHCVVVAISQEKIGVDVEWLKKEKESIVKRYFTPKEQEYYYANEDASGAFFQIWTRKEASLKRTGEGLARPLSSFCVIEDGEQYHTIQIAHAGERYFLSSCTESKEEIMIAAMTLQELLLFFDPWIEEKERSRPWRKNQY